MESPSRLPTLRDFSYVFILCEAMESEVQSYLGSEVALGVKVSSGPLLTMLDSCFPLTLGLWRILTFLPICQSSKIDIHIFIYFYLLLVESQLDYLVYRVARN